MCLVNSVRGPLWTHRDDGLTSYVQSGVSILKRCTAGSGPYVAHGAMRQIKLEQFVPERARQCRSLRRKVFRLSVGCRPHDDEA